MARKKAGKDNIAGIHNLTLKVILFPGMFFQWLQYMMVGGRHYSTVRQRTRMAQSPAMTWVYSAAFYFLFYFLVIRNWR